MPQTLLHPIVPPSFDKSQNSVHLYGAYNRTLVYHFAIFLIGILVFFGLAWAMSDYVTVHKIKQPSSQVLANTG